MCTAGMNLLLNFKIKMIAVGLTLPGAWMLVRFTVGLTMLRC